MSKPHTSCHESIVAGRKTGGTETSKYPEEKKETSISQVAASERERAQERNDCVCIVEGSGKIRQRG